MVKTIKKLRGRTRKSTHIRRKSTRRRRKLPYTNHKSKIHRRKKRKTKKRIKRGGATPNSGYSPNIQGFQDTQPADARRPIPGSDNTIESLWSRTAYRQGFQDTQRAARPPRLFSRIAAAATAAITEDGSDIDNVLEDYPTGRGEIYNRSHINPNDEELPPKAAVDELLEKGKEYNYYHPNKRRLESIKSKYVNYQAPLSPN